jgi:hypothetical protein
MFTWSSSLTRYFVGESSLNYSFALSIHVRSCSFVHQTNLPACENPSDNNLKTRVTIRPPTLRDWLAFQAAV